MQEKKKKQIIVIGVVILFLEMLFFFLGKAIAGLIFIFAFLLINFIYQIAKKQISNKKVKPL